MEGFLPIFFLLVILKIPVFGALYLIYWASKPPVEDLGAAEETDGGMGRWRPEPIRPRGPRRGPHTGGAKPMPACPPVGRTRVFHPPAPARAAATAHQRNRSRPRVTESERS